MNDYLHFREKEGRLSEIKYDKKIDWPAGGSRNVVLKNNTAVELGNPEKASVSALLWTEKPARENDCSITVIGPDIIDSKGMSLPFGKVVVLRGRGFNEENSYERYRELEQIRFGIDLSGYMMRGASQYMKEWSRISYDALDKGFSFKTLGSVLIREYMKLEYVDSAGVIFITSSSSDVEGIQPIASSSAKIISAMNKMIEEMSYDCNACEFTDVCSEVSELRSLRKRLKKG